MAEEPIHMIDIDALFNPPKIKLTNDEIFTQLGGYFRYDNILIGGSYAYSKALDLEWNGKDIDIFFLMPKMETWALEKILNLVFDMVQRFDTPFYQDRDLDDVYVNHFIKNKNKYYMIERQWKRIIAYKDGIKYDLIFVDSNKQDLILNNTGSSISQLYYEVAYGPKPIRLNSISKVDKAIMQKTNICNIYYDQCTDAYASKIENLCKKLGLKINAVSKDIY